MYKIGLVTQKQQIADIVNFRKRERMKTESAREEGIVHDVAVCAQTVIQGFIFFMFLLHKDGAVVPRYVNDTKLLCERCSSEFVRCHISITASRRDHEELAKQGSPTE